MEISEGYGLKFRQPITSGGAVTGTLTNASDYFNWYAYWGTILSDHTGEAMRIKEGNVGIGTTAPAQKLQIDGSIYIRATTGNIGIGTWLPPVGLAVGAGAPSWTAAVKDQNDIYAAGDVEVDGALYVDGFIYGNGSKLTGVSSISGLTANNVSKANATGNGLIDSAIYDVNGNVGIGTTAPGQKLDVNGVVRGTSFLMPATTGGGTNTTALGRVNGAGGSITSNGNGSMASGYAYLVGGGGTQAILSSGLGSFAQGEAASNAGGTASMTSSGSGSVAFGYAAGSGTTASITSSGSGSMAGGAASPGTIVSSNWGSFAWGLAAGGGTLQATGMGSVALGENVQATADNAFALGNEFINPTASTFQVGFTSTPTLTVTAANVGIGTTAPAQKLEVDGSIYIPAAATGSNIGIGTWLPKVGLVVGAGAPSWTVAMANQNDAFVAGDVEVDGALYVDGFIYGNGSKLAGLSSSGTTISGLTANNVSKANATGNNFIDSAIYDVNGFVGIGTTAPAYPLQVNGDVSVAAAGTLRLGANRFAQSFGSTSNYIYTGDDGLYFLDSIATNFLVTILNGGNVGIGIAEPTAKLAVDGSVYVLDGNVGIGTTGPRAKLEIGGGSAFVQEKALSVAATIAVDWSQGNQQYVTLNQAGHTINLSNVVAGQMMRLILCQDGTGARTVTTWDASIDWSGGAAPTLTAAANKCDIIGFVATVSKGSLKVFGFPTKNF
jgi:hypothetical protein